MRFLMVEGVGTNIAKNIANGIVLQVCDLQRMEKSQGKKLRNRKRLSVTKEGDTKNDGECYLTMFASEFLGTGLLMFLGCMGCISEVDNPPAVHHMTSLAFGFVILLIIQGFGHISGAHLNPAVTIAAVIYNVISLKMSMVYVAAQFLGATLGFALLKVLVPVSYFQDGFCMTLPHKLLTPAQAVAIETIITCVLIIVVCAVWDKRNADKTDSIPMRFAFVVIAISMVAGPFTGASMNTARTFAPAVLFGDFQFQWIYWIGPNVGSLIGCGIYKYLFALPEEEEGTLDEKYTLDEILPEKH